MIPINERNEILVKRAVIFDLDGTLLDTLADLTNAANHLLRSHNMPERSAAEVRSFLGNGARDLVLRALPERLDDETFEKYLAEYVKYYRENSAIETKPYDGVLDILDELRAMGIATAVVSNKPDAAVRLLSEKYFGDRIDFALGDKEGIAIKPSPEPVLYAMGELGCERAVFVGDSEVDVLTARRAGLPCVSVTWGFRDKELLEEHGADIFASDARELKAAIFEALGLEE